MGRSPGFSDWVRSVSSGGWVNKFNNTMSQSPSRAETGAILVVSSDEKDYAFVRSLFKNPKWQVRGAGCS
jgi:hypothetical protein